MRVVFMGSPAVAVVVLEQLVTAGHSVVAVVTQPDRVAGRNRRLTPPPVKVAAERLGLPVWQPPTLRDPQVIAQLTELAPDLGVVAAYGEILRKKVLAIPPLGYLNVHPSLLPLHRGPTPVTGAILAGDRETGVTVMQLDQGMDSGPILAQATVSLPPDARAGALTEELFDLGARLLVEAMPHFAAGRLVPRVQDHAQATVTRMLRKEDGRIDWNLPAIQIERMTRAYDPWPGTFTLRQDQSLRILRAAVTSDSFSQADPGWFVGRSASGNPCIASGGGILELLEVQPSGRRPMPASAWLQGIHESEWCFDR
jgi:methionyl-tRNA formyltransferase